MTPLQEKEIKAYIEDRFESEKEDRLELYETIDISDCEVDIIGTATAEWIEHEPEMGYDNGTGYPGGRTLQSVSFFGTVIMWDGVNDGIEQRLVI